MKASIVAWVLGLVAVAGLGADAAERAIEGRWQGSVAGLRLVLHIERDANGVLKGSLDSPDQGALGLGIEAVTWTGDSLRLSMQLLQATYAAKMSADGSELVGTWTQSGFLLPLTLKRGDVAPVTRRPQDPVPPYPYDTLEVAYPNARAGVRLAGTLTTPRGPGPFPCALLITGSGPENRDQELFGHRPFRVLADHLTRRGIAVLRVDDRGVGGSTGSSATATSEDFAGDVLAGVEFLKGRKEIDPRRIGLVGHSEGGLIAPMAAVRSRDVAYIVLMAGPGLRGDSILTMQASALRRLMGGSDEVIAREQAASRKVYEQIRKGDSLGVLAATREMLTLQLETLPAEQRGALGDLDTLAVRTARQLDTPWMRFFLDYDPRPTLTKVRCPVLAIIGGKDFQVPPKENLAALAAAFRNGGHRDATVKEMPGLNHMFQTATTGALLEYSTIEETIAPAALEEITGWILARTTAKR